MNARADAAPDIVSIGYGAGSGPDVASIGLRAHRLLRMARLGLPVAPAFVVGSGWCREALRGAGVLPRELRAALAANVRGLELATGLAFGGTRRPLLVSVHAPRAVPLPGMAQAILDVGLNDTTVHALLRLTGNPRLAWNAYHRLVHAFAVAVHGTPGQPFDALTAHELERHGLDSARELDFRSLEHLTRAKLRLFEDLVGAPFPQQPLEQLEAAVAAGFLSGGSAAAAYRSVHDSADTLGTAVTVQRMVYGTAGGASGACVGFTRDPATGENRLYLDFVANAQGEDVVYGRIGPSDETALGLALPDAERELMAVAQRLEREFRDTQEFEFAVQDGRLFLLQTRTAPRTAWAMLRTTTEQVAEGLIAPREGLARLDGIDLQTIGKARVAIGRDAKRLARGVPASVGAAAGPIALDAQAALRLAAGGQPAILVRIRTENEDLPGIAAAAGLLTATGGRASRAAAVARQLNKACVVACDALSVDLAGRRCAFHGEWLDEGDSVTLDGNTGDLYAGLASVMIEKPLPWLAEVTRWLSEFERSTADPAR